MESFIENMKFIKIYISEVENESLFYEKLNRHYIAHSNLLDGNEILSLNCFLLLDLIYFSSSLFKD